MYAVVASAGVLCGLALMMALLAREKMPLWTACAAVAAGGVLGVALAKALYLLLFWDASVGAMGAAALWQTKPDTFSMVGGAAGAALGAWLAARALRLDARRFLDAFMPAGALTLAFLRGGEHFLGTIGAGRFVEDTSPFARFPFTFQNQWGEHLYAIYLLEAALALACVVRLLCAGKRRAGWRFEAGAFFLAASQVLCESLRTKCLKWGFVRVEQVLCGAVMLALMALACSRRAGGAKKYLPTALAALGVTLIGLLEYWLEKSGIPNSVCYGMMIAVLIGLTALHERLEEA